MAGNHSRKGSVDALDSFNSGPRSPRGDVPHSNHEWQRKGRYQRSGSTASASSSIAGSLDLSVPNRLGTVTETSQNAISTLLQPPIVRTGLLPHTSTPASATHRVPSTRDIPPVALVNIPHVDSSYFKTYLTQVGRLYEARSNAEQEKSQPQGARRGSRGSRDEDMSGESTSRPPSRSGLSPTEAPPTPRRRSSGGMPRRSQLTVAPLSSIPGVYFDEAFHLENPRIFDVVTEKSEVIRTPQPDDGKAKEENGATVAPRKALATNAILQEKLSWYLDTVEIHLISSISAASKSFFAALGSLKEIHSQAADSVQKIQNLRSELAQLDNDMAMGRLEIIRLRQRRQNLHRLACAMKQMQDVIKGAAHCESLVDQGELETSLDRLAVLEDYTCGHLDTTQDHAWLCSEKPEHLVDIRKLKALDGFGRGVNQLRERIGAGFQVRFLDILLSDLRGHVSNASNNDTVLRWALASQRYRGLSKQRPSVSTAYLNSSVKLRENLSAVLIGLKRAKSTLAAASAFREAINKEMKSIIRCHLPSSSDDDAESVLSSSTRSSRAPLSQQDKSAILARNLRNLGPGDAEELLTKAYCGVGEAIRRLQFQCKLLLDLSSDHCLSPSKPPSQLQSITSLDGSLKEPPVQRAPSPNLQQELTEALDLSSLLGQAVDVAQSQINKVLKVRSEQSSHLDMPHFLRYFTLNRLFADECEAVSGRSGSALKSIINAQITDFVHILADSERQALAQAMESDKWDAKDFNDDDSKVLSNILTAMTSDPPAYLSQSYIWDDPHTNGTASELPTNGTPTKKKMRPAIIEEEKFVLTPSVIFLLHGISRFEILVACMPSIASDVSQALVDYLKLFNSLSCQLILGAGATRSSAGLKRINTKHLALASQAIGCVNSVIPYVREYVRRRPGMTSAALGEYDKTKRLYQDHQATIHEKLVEIMSSRAGTHVKAMEAIDWDADAARQASPHMETMTEETALLQRVLGRHMPEPTIQAIMQPVFASYKAQWGRAFREARPQTPAGKTRLMRDAELFQSRLGGLEGGGSEVGKYLVGIVSSKTVVAREAAEPPAEETVNEPPAQPVEES